MTKYKLKALCIEISTKLNVSKKRLRQMENKLEKLKSKPDDENIDHVKELEKAIKDIYEKKAEAAKIRSKCKWFEEGEKSSRYFFQLEKSNGQDKLWNRIKCEDGTFKSDIDSILDEQVKFYEKLFKTEGWDEEKGNWLLQFVNNTLDEDDSGCLDKDIESHEIVTAVKSLKAKKSPGEDGIIAEFYQLYWDLIKTEFTSLVNEIFSVTSLCNSQSKGMISLLFKGGDRENIRNWRPLTVLNCDYKIIAKILSTRLKIVLPKIIHSDQKGFVSGRNISHANRLIQDIIHYVDSEDEEGVIIFLDQQKAFDRIEWGWVKACLKKFNFGPKFCNWIDMLLQDSKTCIKTNGFVSRYVSISRSARQGCPIAPLLYVIQAEPMACAIRADREIEGINLPGNTGVHEAKINMFADDTQLFNKNENSVIKSFDILTVYEMASGAKINYEKTKGLFIGRLKGRRPRFNKIKWINSNVKTLGVHHGYGIDENCIWKPKIDKIRSCLQVWKTRNLSFKGKILIVKSFILSQIGYEVDMRGIPDRFVKEINQLLWAFIWDDKINLVERNVCCMDIEEDGIDMVNIFSFVKSRQIKILYKLLHSEDEAWNKLGKFWLKKFDDVSGQEFFLCKCSDLGSIDLNYLPDFYKNALKSFCELKGKCKPSNVQEILNTQLFCNADIKFQRHSLFFKSFLRSRINTIGDIWNNETKTFKDCDLVYNSLNDKRNCISEYSKIKASIPDIYIKVLKGIEIEHLNNCILKIDGINIYSETGNLIKPEKLRPKNIQKALNPVSIPKAQIKWENDYGEDLNWSLIWGLFKSLDVKNKIIDFHWKSVHNIVYTEYRLMRMGLSQVQGKCHFCKHHFETQSHLFYNCKIIYPLIAYIETLLEKVEITRNIPLQEQNMIIGFYEGSFEGLVLGNIILIVTKWVIWKQRNKIKYEKINISFTDIKRKVVFELKECLNLRLNHKVNRKPNIDSYIKILLGQI